MSQETKTCTRCDETKPLLSFTQDDRCKGGYRNQCRDCRNADRRNGRQKLGQRSDEQFAADTIAYYQKLGTEDKKCSDCSEIKHYNNFSQDRSVPCGRGGICKSCCRERNSVRLRELQQRTPEEVQAEIDRLYPDGCKHCWYCDNNLPLASFTLDQYSRDRLTTLCGGCRSTINRSNRAEMMELRADLKKTGCCDECGYDEDYRALDFAHFERSEKYVQPSGRTLGITKMTKAQFAEELHKVRLLCAICHMLETQVEWQSSTGRNRIKIRTLREVTANAEKLRRGHCIDCHLQVTEDTFCLFDFDHRLGTIKITGIGNMINTSNPSVEEVVLEMAKCDLRCKICHRIETANRAETN